LLLALLLGLGVVYPLLDQQAGWGRLYSAATALLLVTLALGLRVVVGLAGLLDLGYAAFFAIGAYTAAILTGSGSRLGLSLPAAVREPWLALPLAGLAAAGCGLLFGLPSVRTRGEYLALVTLAFGEIVPSLILHAPDWTGGARGMSGLPEVVAGPWPPGSALHGYAAALGLALVTALATSRLAASRTGRAWTAVRDDETAAAACGISPAGARLLAFGVGALFAGLGGALYAALQGHVEPDQFDFTLSLMVLAAVTIGQRYLNLGVVLGALVVAAYGWLLVDLANAGLRGLGGAIGLEGLAAVDLRGDNFAVFGLALYLAVVGRGRER
jgi:branched-chain amino acid transport system permease protein